jgi:hypothetical protein
MKFLQRCVHFLGMLCTDLYLIRCKPELVPLLISYQSTSTAEDSNERRRFKLPHLSSTLAN